MIINWYSCYSRPENMYIQIKLYSNKYNRIKMIVMSKN